MVGGRSLNKLLQRPGNGLPTSNHRARGRAGCTLACSANAISLQIACTSTRPGSCPRQQQSQHSVTVCNGLVHLAQALVHDNGNHNGLERSSFRGSARSLPVSAHTCIHVSAIGTLWVPCVCVCVCVCVCLRVVCVCVCVCVCIGTCWAASARPAAAAIRWNTCMPIYIYTHIHIWVCAYTAEAIR